MSQPTSKKLAFIFAVLGLVVIALALVIIILPRHEFGVFVDDERMTVQGRFDSVRDILDDLEISLNDKDIVIPAIDTKAIADMVIHVQKALTVTVTSDGQENTFWTHQKTLGNFIYEADIELRMSDRLLADGKEVSMGNLDEYPLTPRLELAQLKKIAIQYDQQPLTLETNSQTVGQAIHEAGIRIHSADEVYPPLEEWLYPGMEIRIARSKPYTIAVDNQLIEVRSHFTRSIDIISEAQISLIGQDLVEPSPEIPLQPGATVQITRVTQDRSFEDELIAFQSTLSSSDDLEIDQRKMLSAGSPGLSRSAFVIRFENGGEVARHPAGKWVIRKPINEVIGYGTQIVIRTLDTPEGPIEYWRKVRMWATSYTAASAGKPPDHPGYGITSSGVPAGTGVIAVDPGVVPFRSQVYIDGYGIAFAGDTGGGVKGRIVDLGYDVGQLTSWNRYVDVYYLTPIPSGDQINYLIPD